MPRLSAISLATAARSIRLGALAAAVLLAAWPVETRALRSLPPQRARPAGWDEAANGVTAPDYGAAFSTSRVHDLQIEIAPDEFGRMQADLAAVLPTGPEAMRAVTSGSPPMTADLPGASMLRGGLRLTTRDPAYSPVTVRADGHVWTRVGMRYKGNFSLMMSAVTHQQKLSFRLHFDRFEDRWPDIANQRFFGFKELTFSSNYGDPSQLREALANELFRDRGVAAPRVAFYRVTVDHGDGPVYWGLYTAVEDPADGAMLRTQFGSASGNLYKPDGPGADWTRFDAAGFEKKTNRDRPDFSDIAGAIDALHAEGTGAAWRTRLEDHLDVDRFLRWLAVNQVVDNWDSYGRFAHNYYLYGDPARSGRLVWIPWDNNFAFGGLPFGIVAIRQDPMPRAPGGVAMPAFPFASNDDVLYERADAAWPLIARLLADETYRARYRAHLAEALNGLYQPEAFAARARAWHALIESAVLAESPRYSTVPGTAAFRASLDGPAGLLETVARRRALIEAALARPAVPRTTAGAR
jgi:hypothetical protein